MARINFEDDIEAQDEFWTLLRILGGDRDTTLGKLVRFFRVAQEAYGYDEPMSEDLLRSRGFGDMITSGWATPVENGYQALGAQKHFDWYRQRVEAGKKRGKSVRDPGGRFTSGTPAAVQRKQIPNQPLAPSLALSLSLNTEREEKKSISVSEEKSQELHQTGQAEDIEACKQEWLGTLAHFEQPRETLLPAEELQIARAIQQNGAEAVETALYGARFEPCHEGFNPRDHVNITRILSKDREGNPRIQKFLGFGTQARVKEAARKEREAEMKRQREEPDIPDDTPADPERVKEIMKQVRSKMAANL